MLTAFDPLFYAMVFELKNRAQEKGQFIRNKTQSPERDFLVLGKIFF